MKQQHTLQPKLRFPEFDDSYKNVHLKDIAKFSKGKNISKADIIEDGVFECIRYGELYTTYGEVIDKIVSKTNLDKKNLVFSEANDIIIPASGESAIDIATASCVIKEGVALGGDLNIIKSKENGVFLSYYFNNKKKYEIAKKSQGISVIHIYSDHLKSLNLNIPSLPEQQKIADYLSTIDTKINLLEEKKAQLALYKKAMMQKLFSQKIRFKDDNGNDFPEWEEKRLGAISDINKGQQLNKENFIENGKFKVLNGGISYSGSTNNFNRKGNVITISEGGNSCGYTNYITEDFWLGGHCYALDNLKFNIYDKFLFQYLKFNESNIMRLRVGSGLPNIQKGDLSKLCILIPSLPEQQKIADFLSVLDESIKKVNEQITQTQSFKKAMLQQLFV